MKYSAKSEKLFEDGTNDYPLERRLTISSDDAAWTADLVAGVILLVAATTILIPECT